MPSPLSSVNPASFTSLHPSPSESKSRQFTIPSESVSTSQPSIISEIPSLSESKSMKSGTPSLSVSLIASTSTFEQEEVTSVSHLYPGVDTSTL